MILGVLVLYGGCCHTRLAADGTSAPRHKNRDFVVVDVPLWDGLRSAAKRIHFSPNREMPFRTIVAVRPLAEAG